MGGFLTLCRKDFTAQVRVATRIHLLNLGSIKGELSIEGATGEPRLSCLCSLVSQRKGGLVGGTGSGLAWDKLPEFRRRMPVGKEAGVGGNGWHQLLLRGRTCCWVLLSVSWGRNLGEGLGEGFSRMSISSPGGPFQGHGLP